MSRLQHTEISLVFEPVEMQFWIAEKQQLHKLGADAHIAVEKSSKAELSEAFIVEAFIASVLVEYNGNRIVAAVRGSFMAIQRNAVIAYLHVIPTNPCRDHRLYYFNGQLYCTGYKDKSGCCLKGAYLQVQTSSETNSVVDLHDNQEVPGSAKTTAAQRLNSENSFVTNPENVSIFGEKNEYLENIGEEPYSEEDQRFSSWLSVPHWLSGPVYDEKCHASELGLLVWKVEYSDCTDSRVVPCSPILFYPLPAAGHSYVMYILRRAGNTLVSSDLVSAALRESKVIEGIQRKCRCPETFLLERAKPGSYKVKSSLLNTLLHVVICDYEKYHAGHRGVFASGYPYFVCGLSNPSVYEVLVRAELPLVNCGSTSMLQSLSNHDAPRRMRITVSKSFSGVCQGPEFMRHNHPLPGPRVGVPPIPAVPGRHCCTSLRLPVHPAPPMPIADWLISRAELGEKVETASNDPGEYKNERSSERALPAYRSTNAVLQNAGIILHNKKFFERIELTDACDAICGRLQNSLSLSLGKALQRRNSANSSMDKYVAQRHRLILKYNPNLLLSDQAWFSICPEEIARHIACRLSKLFLKLRRPLRVLEPFCGAGGNAVNCARMPHIEHVYAFDINSDETASARRLAQLYQVDQKMTIETRDCLTLRPEDFPTEIDAIVFSPPWGGPDYLNQPAYDLRKIQEPASYNGILRHLSTFTKNMAVLMPRNSCLDQFVESAICLCSERVELEQNVLAGNVKTVTIYYNYLAN